MVQYGFADDFDPVGDKKHTVYDQACDLFVQDEGE